MFRRALVTPLYINKETGNVLINFYNGNYLQLVIKSEENFVIFENWLNEIMIGKLHIFF